MQYETLGKTGLRVSALAFGGAPLMSRANRQESEQALATAIEGGLNFFDTAPLYGQGDSERLIGRFIAGRRDQMVVCTKCGKSVPEGRLARSALMFKDIARPLVRRSRRIKAAAAAFLGRHTRTDDFDADSVARSLEGSLERLGTDYIDVFLLHEPTLQEIRQGEALDQMERLQDAGKVRAFGVSCNTADEALAAIQRSPRLSVLQLPLSIVEHEPVEKLLPVALDRQIGIVARAPLSKGKALSPQPNEDSASTARRCRLARFAAEKDLTLAQAMLLYVRQQPAVSSVLVSMITPRHASENIAAMNFDQPIADLRTSGCA